MQEKIDHSLSYKIVKDQGSYIVWEAKLNSFWRFLMGLPFLLLGLPLFISSLYAIYRKGTIPSLAILIIFLISVVSLLFGLAIIGSWKALVLDGVMGTLTFTKYFFWRPSTKILYFSSIEGLEISKTTRQFGEELPPQEYYEIQLIYGGGKIYLDGSTNKNEAEEFAKRIAQAVGREVKWV